MKRWALFSLVCVGILVALIALLAWQPTTVGRWCEPNLPWRACFRDWLVPISGLAAALAAAALITHERTKEAQAHLDQLRAIQMRLAAELEILARRYHGIVFDIDNALKADETPIRATLPLPTFTSDATDLVKLGSEESEAIFQIAIDAEKANDLHAFLNEEGEFDQAAKLLQLDAARAALKATEWRDRLGKEIGWKRMYVPPLAAELLAKVRSAEKSV